MFSGGQVQFSLDCKDKYVKVNNKGWKKKKKVKGLYGFIKLEEDGEYEVLIPLPEKDDFWVVLGVKEKHLV